MAAVEHLGRQFLDRHLVEHHASSTQSINANTNESNNYWHDMEHEVMSDLGHEHWAEDQTPHSHSPEKIEFH